MGFWFIAELCRKHKEIDRFLSAIVEVNDNLWTVPQDERNKSQKYLAPKFSIHKSYFSSVQL